MFQLFMSLSIITSSLIFMQKNHSLEMGLMLLIQTFIICLATGIISQTFWLSYIFFLFFLEGMLVLFIYVMSLASNEMFSLSVKTLIWASMMIMVTMLLTIILDMNFLTPITENVEMMDFSNTNALIKENSIMLNKIYNYPTNLMTLVLINYLFISLIAIVKITNAFTGPYDK